MNRKINIKVGDKYENNKGEYTVLSVDPESDAMTIQWKNGDVIETTISLQKRIILRMAAEKNNTEQIVEKPQSRTHPPVNPKVKFTGLVENDFKDNVEGTTWRRRDTLGGAVAQHLLQKEFQFISNAVSRMPMLQWFDVIHKEITAASKQAKFFTLVNEKSLKYGFYIERSDQANDPHYDWRSFINWLKNDSGEKLLKNILTDKDLKLFVCENLKDKKYAEYFLTPADSGWKKEDEKIKSLVTYLNNLDAQRWISFYVYNEISKETVVFRGNLIAKDIADVFEQLMPLYKASIKYLR